MKQPLKQNIEQFSTLILGVVSQAGNLCGTTEVAIEYLKELGRDGKMVYCGYNSGTPFIAALKYIEDNKVTVYCYDNNAKKAILYGVY